MATKRMVEVYGAAEAGRVLGVSEKRVRQLADAGRLEVVSRNPLRVSQTSVVAARKARRTTSAPGSSTSTRRSPAGVDVEAVVTRTVEQLVPRMLETAEAAAKRNEAVLLEQLVSERARAEAAEAELRELRATLAGRGRRRGVFGRREPAASV